MPRVIRNIALHQVLVQTVRFEFVVTPGPGEETALVGNALWFDHIGASEQGFPE
jgi:hypothetical protein